MAIVIYTGEAALANELLPSTKGHGMGWGWAVFTFGMAFFLPMQIFGHVSAKLNPAMLLAHLVLGNINFLEWLALSGSTIGGAMLGAFLHWLHFIPHYKTVPEPPALNRGDNLLRRRDAFREDALQIAGYNTRQERQVKWKPPFTGALYYLRGKSGVEVHTGDELLEHYFETEGPRKHSVVIRERSAAGALPTYKKKGNRSLARRTIQVADLQNTLAQMHVENVIRERQCPTCAVDEHVGHEHHDTDPQNDHTAPPTTTAAAPAAAAVADDDAIPPSVPHEHGSAVVTAPVAREHSAPVHAVPHERSAPIGSTAAAAAVAPADQHKPETDGKDHHHHHGAVGHLAAAKASAAAALANIKRREAKAVRNTPQFKAYMAEEEKRAVALYEAALKADQNIKLSIFATRPAIYVPLFNFISEMMGTAMLLLGALLIELSVYYLPASQRAIFTTCVQSFIISWMIVVFIAGLGGPTTYAANPARDFGPRFMHQLLPIPNKGSSEWEYAWIPVVAPLVGGCIAAGLYRALVELIFPGGLPE